MKSLIVSLMSVFLFSSCAVHVYHHNGKAVAKSDCSDCKTGKECKDCDQKSECTTGYCPLKKAKKSGKKPCCNA